MPVHLTNRQRRFPVDGPRLVRQAQACLDHLGMGPAELSVLLVNDRAIRALNRDFRGVDRATDVLSFPQHEGTPAAIRRSVTGAAAPALGDVVISVETAHARAAREGIRPHAELALLLVHGVLHLAGLDHERGPAQAARMRRAERETLARLGYDAPGLVDRAGGTP
jgi:probable rRNA maturation factor